MGGEERKNSCKQTKNKKQGEPKLNSTCESWGLWRQDDTPAGDSKPNSNEIEEIRKHFNGGPGGGIK